METKHNVFEARFDIFNKEISIENVKGMLERIMDLHEMDVDVATIRFQATNIMPSKLKLLSKGKCSTISSNAKAV